MKQFRLKSDSRSLRTLLTVIVVAAFAYESEAQIFNWQTGEVLPGTEDITLEPGVVLVDFNLRWADFRNADLVQTIFYQTNLDDADFSGSLISGTIFVDSPGFTAEQLYSTASFQARSLKGIGLTGQDLSEWNFNGQDLSYAQIIQSQLDGTDFTGAVVNGTLFSDSDLSSEQLYSTASYRSRNLDRIWFWDQDFSGQQDLVAWDFSNQSLRFAIFSHVSLFDTNFDGARVEWATFKADDFTPDQLYSTSSYGDHNLQGVQLSRSDSRPDLSGWDFSGQNLASATLYGAKLDGTDFRGANLKNVNLDAARNLDDAIFDASTVYNQWTIFPSGFDPQAAGLTFETSAQGDLDGDGVLDRDDINFLTSRVHSSIIGNSANPLRDEILDLTSDSIINHQDHEIWIKELKQTWFGDANLDGEFNSADLVQIFQAGEYEDDLPHNSLWTTGDWNADGDFTSSDLVAAFEDGGYDQGPLGDVRAVPEPQSYLMTMIVGAAVTLFSRHIARRQGRASHYRKAEASGKVKSSALSGERFGGHDSSRCVWMSVVSLLIALALCTFGRAATAAIYRWDDGLVIPGTEDIELGPGVNLDGLDLSFANLVGDDDGEFDLANASLRNARLSHALLPLHVAGTDFTGAQIDSATITGYSLTDAFSAEQLYSTTSYQEMDLRGIILARVDANGWDLHGQDLSWSVFTTTDLRNVDFRNANLTGAQFGLESSHETTGLHNADLRGAILSNASTTNDASSAIVDSTTIYNQWSRLRIDTGGMTFVESAIGDFDANGVLNESDISLLTSAVLVNERQRFVRLKEMYDLRRDHRIDRFDLETWVCDVKNTWLGDANLDGEFNSSDLVQVFAAGMYGVEVVRGTSHLLAKWSEGDWNSDGEFNSEDLVAAFQNGGFEQGTLDPHVCPVPEPNNTILGDVNGDRQIDISDIDALADALQSGLTDLIFDLDDDGEVSRRDHTTMIHDVFHTWIGDANLDGDFNSGDLVDVFQAGKYEDEIVGNSTWSTGDWTGDGDFDSGDLVAAFQDGGYEQGLPSVRAVPEPSSLVLLLASVIVATARRSRRTNS